MTGYVSLDRLCDSLVAYLVIVGCCMKNSLVYGWGTLLNFTFVIIDFRLFWLSLCEYCLSER